MTRDQSFSAAAAMTNTTPRRWLLDWPVTVRIAKSIPLGISSPPGLADGYAHSTATPFKLNKQNHGSIRTTGRAADLTRYGFSGLELHEIVTQTTPRARLSPVHMQSPTQPRPADPRICVASVTKPDDKTGLE